MADTSRPSLWARLLRLVRVRPKDPVAAAAAEHRRAEVREQAKRDQNNGRGESVVG